jgi:hypothetical protein
MQYTGAAVAFRKWERKDALAFPPISKTRYAYYFFKSFKFL